ncbi:MAG: dockerin type I domain-containing protein [Planctomycetota bacterium]
MVLAAGQQLRGYKTLSLQPVRKPAARLFEVQYVVLMGDVNNDGYVQNADASAVYPRVSFLPVPDDNRYDVDGDGYVKNADASAVYPRVSFLPKPTKPSGH